VSAAAIAGDEWTDPRGTHTNDALVIEHKRMIGRLRAAAQDWRRRRHGVVPHHDKNPLCAASNIAFGSVMIL
jgi:hypothetical protein